MIDIGALFTRRPLARWITPLVWGSVCLLLSVFASGTDPATNERNNLLPEEGPYCTATQALRRDFPLTQSLGEATVLFERSDGPLTPADRQYVNRIARLIRVPRDNKIPRAFLEKVTTTAPGLIDLQLGFSKGFGALEELTAPARESSRSDKPAAPAPQSTARRMLGSLFGQPAQPQKTSRRKVPLHNPLRSPVTAAGQATFIRVHMPADFNSITAARMIDHIRDVLHESPAPKGLRFAITGTAGFAHDYAAFLEQGHRDTMGVTLLAVVFILLLVYRAPLAAAIPLAAISLAAGVMLYSMDIAQHLGVPIGMTERIFTFVLVYGAGIDYSLLLISRYRELLPTAASPQQAVRDALRASLPAILASAGTDAAGLFMLTFAQFQVFRAVGPVVAVSLLVAMLASITLVPALLAIFGRAVFWCGHRQLAHALPNEVSKTSLWMRIGRGVTRRPGLVLLASLLLLAWPVWRGVEVDWAYDAMTGAAPVWSTPADPHGKTTAEGQGIGNAAVGIEMATRHWPIGEIAPVAIYLKADHPLPRMIWAKVSENLVKTLQAQIAVSDVRTVTQPLGRAQRLAEDQAAQADKADGSIVLPRPSGLLPLDMLNMFGAFFGSREGKWGASQYLAPDLSGLRVEVVLSVPPMGHDALATLEAIRNTASKALRDTKVDATVHLAGTTTQIAELRDVTRSDFPVIVTLVLGVIFLIVLALLRDVWLSGFMVAAIALSYLATLGLCEVLCPMLFGGSGLDWKVQSFLFVVMAAVGVDYNIFLADRLRQEARRFPPREAVARAVGFTGPVISSCGLIMAGTLGSMMVGEVLLMKQLGFAMGLGMLLDTFLIRPLLLPAFAARFERTGYRGTLAKKP